MKSKIALFLSLLFFVSNYIYGEETWEVIKFTEDKSINPVISLHNQTHTSDVPCYVVKVIIDTNSDDVKFLGVSEFSRDENNHNVYMVYIPEEYYTFTITINGYPTDYDLEKLKIKDGKFLPSKNKVYELHLKRTYTYPNKNKANMQALALSLVPGIGLMQKGYTGEGVAYLAGDVVLIGAGIGLNIFGNNQKKIMNDRNTTLGEYKKAKSNYDSAKTASYICYGAAAGVYVLNLIRSYVARPKSGAPLQWTFAPSMDSTLPFGPNMSVNFALEYKF